MQRLQKIAGEEAEKYRADLARGDFAKFARII